MNTTTKKSIEDLSLASLYGTENEQVIYSLAAAYSAVLHLVAEGFKVTRVRIEQDTPMINIRKNAMCASLSSVSSFKVPSSDGSYYHRKIAEVKGIQVTWTDRVQA